MKSNDIKSQREQLRARMQQAARDGDTDLFTDTFGQLVENIHEDVLDQARAEMNQRIDAMQQETDTRILACRGKRQLTSEETNYYQKLSEAMRAKEPRQALANIEVTFPQTVFDAVFEELTTSHPLLSKIDFVPTTAAVKMLYNTNGYQTAAWGKLTSEIVRELSSGFKEIDSGLCKLSAFLAVSRDMLDLGPEWLDNYVRQVLYEALANGMEAGIVSGDGNEKPIGMNRQVGDDVVVTGGVYPAKEEISVSSLDIATLGNLVSLLAVDDNGKPRPVSDLILLVHPQDYYQKIMPATNILSPDGAYRSTMPYPVEVIQTSALENGKAILGMATRYFGMAGSSTDGTIEYSDENKFLEDERVYKIKAYGNGLPKDNNSFLCLDISALSPAVYKVQQVDAPTPSDNAYLSDLKIGSLTLSPSFASGTLTYTASTTNATNTVKAIPSDAGATIVITNTDKTNAVEISNGSAVTWYTGENTLTIAVTAADGSATKSYTVTVTKS